MTRTALIAMLAVGAAVVTLGLLTRDPAVTPPVRPRVVTTLELAGSLGAVAPGFGSGWIADGSAGAVLRVGTRFRQTQARVPVGARPRLAVGAGAAWVLAQGGTPRVLRIDPATNRVTSRVAVRGPGGAPLTGVQILRGSPWAIGLGGAVELDPRSGRVRRSVAIAAGGAEPFSVLADAGALWVLTREQRLLRYALPSGRRTGALPVGLPGATVALPTPAGPVLIDRGGRLARADTGDGRLAWQRATGTSIGAALVDGGALWIHVADARGGSDRLFELDLRTGAERSVTPLPEFGAAGIARVGRELWITTPDGELMVVALQASKAAG